MMINLAASYRTYSPEELRELAYKGLLEVNGFDMTDVFEYIFQDVNFEEDLDSIRTEAYDEGWREAGGCSFED